MKTLTRISILLAALILAACNPSNESTSLDTPEAAQSAETSETPEMKAAVKIAMNNAAEYPLDTCVISGKKLDSMGGPYIHNHEGTEVRFCCEGCLPAFNRDPGKHLKKIAAASAMKSNPSEAAAEHAHDH